ncbi:MAG TPA: prepilin-type N-terminal cleavage/methylation domain-containing protein [Gemmataceae bacterium]|jgi:prepilin-type N-terminal cleavage/methylation domain-containing protein|nr:prepilin-type N-terminal cleavage/methylation domain-containing protein [Gemmataceae bacterium]
MRLQRSTQRRGFTLLEVLLASALAVILMAALYVALDVQLRLADAGRESIEQATINRAITHRLEIDLSSGLGPVAPPIDNSAKNSAKQLSGPGNGSSGAASGTANGSSGMSGSASASANNSASAANSGSSTDTGAVTDATTSDSIPFQAGVIGTADQLVIYAARVSGLGKDIDDTGEKTNPADARRVVYWLTDKGLARQEIPWITSQDLQNSTDPYMEEGKEEKDYVIAEEVTKLQFEYWDGTSFTDTWDGRTLNTDGKTLKGPPMAIRVHFWLKVPGPNPGEMIEKEFRHTVMIRSAAGPAVADTTAATTSP